MKRGALLLILILMLLTLSIQGCEKQEQNKDSCSTNSDCYIGGCSGTLCGTKDFIENQGFTTCEWKDEYKCYKQTTCECINTKCAWKQSEEFLNCLEEN